MILIAFKDYIGQYDKLTNDLKELESNLKGVRGVGSDWELGIVHDKRMAVVLLYAEVKRLRELVTKVETQTISVETSLDINWRDKDAR